MFAFQWLHISQHFLNHATYVWLIFLIQVMMDSAMIQYLSLRLEDSVSHINLNHFKVCVYVCVGFLGSLTECVKEAAFPCISSSCDHHLDSAAQPLAPPLIL